jgi:signal peptidase
VNLSIGLRRLRQVAAWSVILLATAVLAIAVLVPRMAGATPYVILTGSMEPQMPPGTLVVVRSVDPGAITTGSVITYQLESGNPTVVTHRVRSVGLDAAGEWRFVTQGDANNDPDPRQVMPVQIKGERWYYVPYLGYVTSVTTGQQHQIALVVVVVGLLGYAAAMFLAAVRDRRRAPRPAGKEVCDA